MSMDSMAYDAAPEEPTLERRDTGIRIALSILFTIAAEILASLVGLMVLFSLVWSFITRRPPSEGVRSAANRLIAYNYRIGRWLTYNEDRVPFPFDDFPEPLEPSHWDPSVRESDALGVTPREELEED